MSGGRWKIKKARLEEPRSRKSRAGDSHAPGAMTISLNGFWLSSFWGLPGPNPTYGRSALTIDKISKGTKPADLPLELPTKLELMINLKITKALGLTIPPVVMMRADKVIK